MKPIHHNTGRLPFMASITSPALLLSLVLATSLACAQDTKSSDEKPAGEISQTVFLHNVTQQNEVNEIQNDLRNMLPHARIYSVSTQNAITIHGTPDELEAAQKIVAELDRPRKVFRLTFTVTQFDNGKRTGSQTYALIAANGHPTLLKQGSKVPIVTGTFDSDNSKANTQVQYEDVGLSIHCTAEAQLDGLVLNAKIEQSGPADEKSGVGPQDPVLRQSVLESESALTLGKPLILGSLDIPGSTQKQEISVVAESAK